MQRRSALRPWRSHRPPVAPFGASTPSSLSSLRKSVQVEAGDLVSTDGEQWGPKFIEGKVDAVSNISLWLQMYIISDQDWYLVQSPDILAGRRLCIDCVEGMSGFRPKP